MIALLLILLAAADFPILGRMEVGSQLIWAQSVSDDVTGYAIYAARPGDALDFLETNLAGFVSPFNPFSKVGQVPTPAWGGDGSLHGSWIICVTALTPDTESEPSEMFQLDFRHGVPVAPTQFAVLASVHALATSAIPVRVTSPPLPTISNSTSK